MSKEEILEGNFLIAKFMGYDYPDINNQVWLHSLEWHSYHHDWNKLMPVIEKIESLFDDSISVNIYDERCKIEISTQYALATDIHLPHEFYNNEGPKLKSTWMSVVQFIKWYNQHPKQ